MSEEDDKDDVRAGREDRTPKRMGSKTVAGIVMSAEQVTTMMLDQEDILEKVSTLFEIHNNPPPTAAQMAVNYIMADRIKMAITGAFIIGVLALVTGTYVTWDREGNMQIGANKDGSSMVDDIASDSDDSTAP